MVLRKQRSYGATHLNAKTKKAPPPKKVVPPSPKGKKAKKGKG